MDRIEEMKEEMKKNETNATIIYAIKLWYRGHIIDGDDEMKNFGIIFDYDISEATLSVTTAFMLESRLDEMETNIDEINTMLKDMTFVGNTPEG